MNDEPLIWTCKGNLPESSLVYKVKWTVTDNEITFEEFYYDSTGDEVKHSAHKYLPKATLPFGVQQGDLGG